VSDYGGVFVQLWLQSGTTFQTAVQHADPCQNHDVSTTVEA